MKIRTECPKKNNKYYNNKRHNGLSDAVNGEPMISGLTVLDNCVGWANSRFNEIINDPDLTGVVKTFKYQLVCNAENFIESAKRQGLKISSTPIEGGIMVWQRGRTLSGDDGAGHVAVVERVYDDGTILTSESGWRAWTFKTVRRDNNDGRWGQNSAYKFRGCIINPAVKDPKVVPVPPLNVDGIGGACTVRAMQRFFGTLQDGVISGQSKAQAKYYPALKAVEYGKGGSPCVRKLQKWIDIPQDGIWNEQTSKALQKKLGVSADGIFGSNSMKALQKYLNDNDKARFPADEKPEKPPYKVIDVSVWQGDIDWAKVKADGVVGAIIRYADGASVDTKFERNMTQAKYYGIHIGAYIYSRAKTKEQAQAEATRIFNACKKFEPDMPLYIDLEAKGYEKYADTVAIAFLNKMKALGGRGGVYANLNWWNNYLTKIAKNYSSNPFWIAQYYDRITYKNPSLFGMWQYSSSGKVEGIKGNVDMDWCYKAYWDNAPKPTEPTKPTIPTEPVKKSYSGEYPDIKVTINGAKAVAEKANEYAYKENAPKSDTLFEGGHPTPAYKSALASLPYKSHDWCAGARKGANCDVFVWVCVRKGDVDGKFPSGLWNQLDYMEDNKWQKIKASDVKPGDIYFYRKDVEGKHGHIGICYSGGRVKEASHEEYYPKTNKSLKARLNTKGKKYVKVFRPPSHTRDYLKHGDTSNAVKDLQAYLNWFDPSNKLAVDGIFKDKTEEAVKKFQKATGLTADGYFGTASLAKAKEIKK